LPTKTTQLGLQLGFRRH